MFNTILRYPPLIQPNLKSDRAVLFELIKSSIISIMESNADYLMVFTVLIADYPLFYYTY